MKLEESEKLSNRKKKKGNKKLHEWEGTHADKLGAIQEIGRLAIMVKYKLWPNVDPAQWLSSWKTSERCANSLKYNFLNCRIIKPVKM